MEHKNGVNEMVEDGKSRKFVFLLSGIMGALFLIVLFLVIWIVLLNGFSKKDDDKTEKKRVDDESTEELDEEDPFYTDVVIPEIDIYAENVEPGRKQLGMEWDSTLFYWLEDVDQTDSSDGYLNSCNVSKKILRDAKTQELIQYEIYRDADTDEIYKIVSIEQSGDELDLTDYYYQNGVPNFIFMRSDSVYTPTYATPDKVGERFYFSNDVMVRWRMIRTPGEIGEYVLATTDVPYSQSNYFTEIEENRKAYDEAERKRLNAAYNTYNAILASDSVGYIKGTVKNAGNKPVEDATVGIYRAEDDVLLYRGQTDGNGAFEIAAYLDGTECYLVAYGDEEYRKSVIQGIILKDTSIYFTYDNLILYEEDGEEYSVDINIYAAMDVCINEEEYKKDLLGGGTATIRAGSGVYDGESLMTVEADASGKIRADLPSGTYTVQIDVQGYYTSYVEVQVLEQETTVESYVIPEMEENTMGIVLKWDAADVDLDMTLFTPYQSSGGDMAHIGGHISSDEHGNYLVSDNSSGCEVLYFNAEAEGSYKLYVNDYTDSSAGNYGADILGKIQVSIYVYDKNGFVAEYTYPKGESGVVWEALEISGKQLMPGNRVYKQVDGKSWWTEDKKAGRENEEAMAAYEEFLNNRRPAYYDNTYYYLDDFIRSMSWGYKVDYGYMDIELDDRIELRVNFINNSLIFTYYEGTLYVLFDIPICTHGGSTSISYAGVLEEVDTTEAGLMIDDYYSYLTKDGDMQELYSRESILDAWVPISYIPVEEQFYIISQLLHEKGETSFFVTIYCIDGMQYYTLDSQYNTLDSDELYTKYVQYLKGNGIIIYSHDEIDEMIREKYRNLIGDKDKADKTYSYKYEEGLDWVEIPVY